MGATVESAKNRKKKLKTANCTICGAELITVMLTKTIKCDGCYVEYMKGFRRGPKMLLVDNNNKKG